MFGVRIAAVFMIVVSMLGLRSGFLPRWLVMVGFVSGVAFLLTVTYFDLLDLSVSRFRLVIPPCADSNVASGDGVLKLNPDLYPPVDPVTGEVIIYQFNYRY